jgi:hypothetical protein
MDALIAFFLIDLHIIIIAAAVRYRENIKKWLNTPYSPEDDRELYLTRRREDIEKELAWIEANKTKGE